LTANVKYTVQPLGKQDRAAFHCGNEELDSYFLERASRDVRENLSAVFVLLTEEDPNTLGYYTLSPQEVEIENLPEDLRKRTGRYKRVGVTLLGRLAISQEQQGKGAGEFLLLNALERILHNTKHVASFAVVVDPKDERAAKFYEKYGFLRLENNRQLLPMKTIKRLFESLEKQEQEADHNAAV